MPNNLVDLLREIGETNRLMTKTLKRLNDAVLDQNQKIADLEKRVSDVEKKAPDSKP